MDSGTAAIIGAGIGLLGSIVASTIAPYLVRRAEQKEADRRARMDALRRLIPLIVEGATRIQSLSDEDVALIVRYVSEFETWLLPDEWAIGRMVTVVTLTTEAASEEATKRARAMVDVLPRWLRGEIDANDAKLIWERFAGVELTPLVPRG